MVFLTFGNTWAETVKIQDKYTNLLYRYVLLEKITNHQAEMIIANEEYTKQLQRDCNKNKRKHIAIGAGVGAGAASIVLAIIKLFSL